MFVLFERNVELQRQGAAGAGWTPSVKPAATPVCCPVFRNLAACPFAVVTAYELFAGMVEFEISRQLTDIVTVTDARMERILRRAGWPLRRLGNPSKIGNTLAAADYLAISIGVLASLRRAGGLSAPALWVPVTSRSPRTTRAN